MRGPAGTGRGGVSMAGGREGQNAIKGNGVRGHRLPSPPCSEFAQVFQLSVSMRKVAGEHPFCVLIYMNSYIFQICLILFILLSYLIFDFVCLTLSSADTHGIAKYACTYKRDTHTHAHTQAGTKSRKIRKKGKKVGNTQKKKEVGSGKKERRKKERTKRAKKEKNERKRGGEKKRKKKRKREGDGFRGEEERRY